MSRERTPAAIEAGADLTMAWLDERIADERAISNRSQQHQHRAFHAGQAAAYMDVRDRMMRDLLTGSGGGYVKPDAGAVAADGATVDDLFEIFVAARIDATTTDIPGGPLAYFEQSEAAKHQIITLLTGSEGRRESLDALQSEVGAWGERTFPTATDFSVVNHFHEETVELQCAVYNVWSQIQGTVSVAEEAADCLLLLLHIAHRNGFSLIEEARRKFAVNQTRTWNTAAPGGYVKHDTEPQP